MRQASFVPLAIWVGAMICAVLAATHVFGALEENKKLAGDIMAGIFRAVDYLGIVAAGLAAVVSFGNRPRFVLAVLLVAGAGVSVFVIHPKIVARENIETWHKASEILWSGLIVGGLILSLMGPPRANPRAH